MVTITDIELGKFVVSMQSVEEFGDERKGVSIMDGPFIKFSIIINGVQFSIFLFNEEKRGSIGAF